jgi:2-polyprenyl-6-methoxyphenol hydroxylase-like FAD-dependent oxidoreductase
MAGLFATALLRKAGWNAAVFERSPIELFGRGAGIVTHEELLEALELSGASLRDLGITVKERVALGRDGEVVDCLDFEQIVTSWDRLHQIMRSIIPSGPRPGVGRTDERGSISNVRQWTGDGFT